MLGRLQLLHEARGSCATVSRRQRWDWSHGICGLTGWASGSRQWPGAGAPARQLVNRRDGRHAEGRLQGGVLGRRLLPKAWSAALAARLQCRSGEAGCGAAAQRSSLSACPTLAVQPLCHSQQSPANLAADDGFSSEVSLPDAQQAGASGF